MSNSLKSPYIENPGRLADVIAAIQATGVYGRDELSFGEWADIIDGNSSRTADWVKVFEDHPEFFRVDQARTKASLVLRQSCPRSYVEEREKRVGPHAYEELSEQEKDKISREPLSLPDIRALIDIAISLHSRAAELQRDARWWIPLAASFLSGLIGALVGILGLTLKR